MASTALLFSFSAIFCLFLVLQAPVAPGLAAANLLASALDRLLDGRGVLELATRRNMILLCHAILFVILRDAGVLGAPARRRSRSQPGEAEATAVVVAHGRPRSRAAAPMYDAAAAAHSLVEYRPAAEAAATWAVLDVLLQRVYKYGARRRPQDRQIHIFLAIVLRCRRLPHPVADVPSVSGEQAPKPTSPRVPARGRGRIRFLGSTVVTARWTSSSLYAADPDLSRRSATSSFACNPTAAPLRTTGPAAQAAEEAAKQIVVVESPKNDHDRVAVVEPLEHPTEIAAGDGERVDCDDRRIVAVATDDDEKRIEDQTPGMETEMEMELADDRTFEEFIESQRRQMRQESLRLVRSGYHYKAIAACY